MVICDGFNKMNKCEVETKLPNNNVFPFPTPPIEVKETIGI
jgi:hypothetical protein